MQRLQAAVQLAELLNQLVEMLWIAGSLLTGPGVLHLVLAESARRPLAEGLDTVLRATVRVRSTSNSLLQVAMRGVRPGAPTGRCWASLQPGDQAQLGGFPGSIHTHQADGGRPASPPR